MNYPDYGQTAEDHLSLLILVKQVGCHLKPKAFSRIYERICRFKKLNIHSQQRMIHLRYKKLYPLENNEWGEFQAHRKAVGLLCIGKCEKEEEVDEVYRLYEDLDHAYSPTLYDSRLILFGLNKDGSVLEKRLRKLSESDSGFKEPESDLDTSQHDNNKNNTGTSPIEQSDESKRSSPKRNQRTRSSLSPKSSPVHAMLKHTGSTETTPHPHRHKDQEPTSTKDQVPAPKSHVLCYPHEDQCPDLEEMLQDYVASLFWILDSKRLDRSHERQEKPPLLMTPFEKKDLVGVDTDNRMYKKRCQGRLRKHLGDLCLLAGLPGEALLHYNTAVDILKTASDWMWLAGAYEGICSANIAIARPAGGKPGFPRNLSFSSFSVKRGTSANKENKLKTGGLTRGLPNGLDLDDNRPRTSLAVDEIIEKYREAILNYSKFSQGGGIELECSLKACRVAAAHERCLAAADFLQNVVYINLPLSDEEKIQRYGVMSDLYDQIGMRRKGALFKRLAGMQCVALTNPKPAWQHCYHLLLRAMDGYKLSLDPKDVPKDHEYGWPLVQMRLLHEVIYTARKMGNPAIAIRHLCFLLHQLFEHLRPQERKELSSILESYTVRCEAAPQSLALDNGTILPPVPFLKFPAVKSFKLLEAAPHLKPVRLKADNQMADSASSANNLFIYSPIQQRNNARSLKKDVRWAEGDLCEIMLQLFNPMPYELRISNLGLLTEGVVCETIPQSLSLPAESGPYQIKISTTPREPGSLNILGYTSKVLGVRSHCRLRDLSNIPVDKVNVKVISPLPKVKVKTSLPKSASFSSLANSDIVVTSASVCLHAGQRCECEISVTNDSQVPIEEIQVSFDSKLAKGSLSRLLDYNEDNLRSQLPLQPGCQACFTLYIFSDTDTICDTRHTADLKPSPSGSSEDLLAVKVTECLLKLQYSGGEGLVDGYCRHCAVAMTIETLPSICIHKWDVLPAASSSQCHLVLDVENRTEHLLEIISEDRCLLSLAPRQCKRCSVVLPKCSMPASPVQSLQSSFPSILTAGQSSVIPSQSGVTDSQSSLSWSQSSMTAGQSDMTSTDGAALKWQRKVLADHVQNFVDVRWRLPAEDKEGSLSLDKLFFTSEQMAILQVSTIRWDLSVLGQSSSLADTVKTVCGEPVTVDWSLTNQSDVVMCDVCVSLRVFHDDLPESHDHDLQETVVINGNHSLAMDKVASGDSVSHSCLIYFLHPGTYKVEVTCQGQSQPVSQGQVHEPQSDVCSAESNFSPEVHRSQHNSPVMVVCVVDEE